jgi:outer membrane assembly lipoprotein YfiO
MVAVSCLCIALLWCGSVQAEKRWDGTKWIEERPAVLGTPRGDIATIRALLEAERVKEAVIKVEGFLARHAHSPLCEEAMNLAGCAKIAQGHYWDAYEWFERQIEEFPNGPLLSRALDREYQIGEAFLQGRKRRVMRVLKLSAEGEGVEILDKITEHSPASFLARKALLRIAKYHFDEGEFDESVRRYDEFVEQYPHSPKRAMAMIQAAHASLQRYRGVQWDTDPLHEAAERYRVIQAAFPAAAKAEGIASILAEIHASLAHKVYHMGLFYERTKKPRAAAYYYSMVVRDYRTTRWASDARTRLGVLGNIIPLKPSLLPKDFKPSRVAPNMPPPVVRVNPAMPVATPNLELQPAPKPTPKPVVDKSKPIPMRDLLKELRKSREDTSKKD